jgi:phage protein D
MAVVEKTMTPCLLVGEGTKKEVGDALLELEVEEHYELASVFRLKLAIVRGEDGLWAFLDQDTAAPWTKLQIKMNVGDREEDLITGYVTQIRIHIDTAEGKSYLELVGMDTSCLMSVEEVIKDWPEKSDSDIATAIFDKYKLDYEVDVIDVVHAERMSTILQRESDIQFLKRLARRNGCECVIVGTKGYFTKPDLSKTPLPVLAAHFGKETNLTSFDATWNALRPTAVECHQIDAAAKEIQSVTVEQSSQTLLGKDAAEPPELPDGKTPRMFVRHHVTTGTPEATNLANAIGDEAQWFIEVRGEVDSVEYGDILHARRTVPVKGVGELLSGLYYVTSVKHVYNVDRYVQHFTGRRNATTAKASDLGPAPSLF